MIEFDPTEIHITLFILAFIALCVWVQILRYKLKQQKIKPYKYHSLELDRMVQTAKETLTDHEKSTLAADIINVIIIENLRPEEKKIFIDYMISKINFIKKEHFMKTGMTIKNTTIHDEHDFKAGYYAPRTGKFNIETTSKNCEDKIKLELDEKEVEQLQFAIDRYYQLINKKKIN